MSRLKIIVILFLSLFLLSCNFDGTADIENKNELHSVITNQVYVDQDGDDAVILPVSTINNLISDSRSIMPDKPTLYFSVVGSTAFSDTDGNGIWSKNETADCTAAAASVIAPYYGSVLNSTSGMLLSLKVKKTYYLTVYGTQIKPSEIPLYGSHTSDSMLRSYSPSEKITAGLTSAATDYETYCAFRNKIVAALKEDAVVQGTVCLYIDTDANGSLLIRKNNASGAVVSSISIPSSINGITGTGIGVFVFDIPATYRTTEGSTSEEKAAKYLADKNNYLNYVKISWTPKDKGVSGYLMFNIEAYYTTGKILEFKPYMATGNYDLDISFLNSSHEDIFVLHDSITIWKNQYSKPFGGSYFYSVRNYDLGNTGFTDYVSYASRTGGKDNALVEGSAQMMDLDTFGSPYSSGVNACKAYSFTAEDVKDFERNVFYVSGSGGSLVPAASGAADGSLFRPFSSVQDALDAIASKRASGKINGYEDWNIVVDGAETDSKEISFTNTNSKKLNITIRNFKQGERVKLSNRITVLNANEDSEFNLYLTNVDWYPRYTSYKVNFGTDVYLDNVTFAYDSVNDKAGYGTVVLNKKEAGVTENGLLIMNASDLDTRVMNIMVSEADFKVLDYKYHEVNSSTVSSVNFTTVAGITDRVKISASAVGYNLTVDTQVGDTYGCIISQSE